MSDSLYQKELDAVRARANRLHKDLEDALATNKELVQRNQLSDYRLTQLEKGLNETRREMVKLHTESSNRLKLVEDFVTREGASGVPLKTIYLIAGVVATVVGGVLAAALRVMGL